MNDGVLFVCSHNSARSQMAHAWLEHLAPGRFDAYSAGVEPGALNPLAVEVMAEVGIDIADRKARGIEEYLGRVPVYYLVIVCDRAAKTCPRIWPGAQERLHWFFEDPSAARGTRQEKLAVFRRVRDQIKTRVEEWLTELGPARSRSASIKG